jgi:hypothetical protein
MLQLDRNATPSSTLPYAEGDLACSPTETGETTKPIEMDTPLPAVVPYGFLRCTCEKTPRLTYINDQLLDTLGFSQAHRSWREVLKEDINFIIPVEERDKFTHYLEEALETRRPVNIEHKLLCNGGSRIALMGWINVRERQNGTKEFAILYMRPEYKHTEKQSNLEDSYFHALKSVYNLIFELDLVASTVECIHGRDTSEIGALADVNMTIESAKTFWLNNYFEPKDRPMMTVYLDRITSNPPDFGGHKSLQTEFRVNWIDGLTHRYSTVAVQLDSRRVLLCMRDVSHEEFSSIQTIDSLKMEKVRYWMDEFTTSDPGRIGMALFEQTEHERPLLYASPPIRRFLSNGQDIPPRNLDLVGITEEEFAQFLDVKRMTKTIDIHGKPQTITLTCRVYPKSERALYIMWVYFAKKDGTTCHHHAQPEAEAKKSPKKRIFARTFGHFDLFVDGVPVTFSSAKEKELMALLIDRNGGTLSTNEAVSHLWEDEAADERVCTRYRKLAMGLKKTLESYGIDHILISQKGVRSVDVTAFECDYYELLAGNEKYQRAFHNAYMSDYSWSEETLASLWVEADE